MSSRAPGHHGYQRASGRLRFASTADINSSHRCLSRRRERAASADRASEPTNLREIIRDGSSVRHQTKGNDLRCHNHPAWGEGKGRREYAYTPERPGAVLLLGSPHHRIGDRGCEPAHLNLVLGWMLPPCTELRNPATVAQYWGFCRRHSREVLGQSVSPRTAQAAERGSEIPRGTFDL
jgi:hypothetical protein